MTDTVLEVEMRLLNPDNKHKFMAITTAIDALLAATMANLSPKTKQIVVLKKDIAKTSGGFTIRLLHVVIENYRAKGWKTIYDKPEAVIFVIPRKM
jgi:ethanolamine utilization protein EutA (predicted chaperonin)